MRTHVRWFGPIALLVVALAVPLPAWARVVLSHNGSAETTQVPPAGVWNQKGDVETESSPAPGFGTGNPCVCMTTGFKGGAGLVSSDQPVGKMVSRATTPAFNLNFVVGATATPPAIIKVTFKVRYSTDSPATPFPVTSNPKADHFLARLITSGGIYEILVIDPNGPQKSGTVAFPTTVTGFTGFTHGNADSMSGHKFDRGTGTLAVSAVFYPTNDEKALLKAAGSAVNAVLQFVISDEDRVSTSSDASASCVDDIVVEVTP